MLLYDRSFVKGNYSIFPYVLREKLQFLESGHVRWGSQGGTGFHFVFFLDCHETVEWKKGDLTSLISKRSSFSSNKINKKRVGMNLQALRPKKFWGVNCWGFFLVFSRCFFLTVSSWKKMTFQRISFGWIEMMPQCLIRIPLLAFFFGWVEGGESLPGNMYFLGYCSCSIQDLPNLKEKHPAQKVGGWKIVEILIGCIYLL